MSYSDLLKNIWNHVYDPHADVLSIIETFFHPGYEQYINGICMKREEYIQHVIAQKQTMIIDIIDYEYFLEKENELFAIYCPKGKNKNNFPIEAEVIAYFKFHHQQIIKIHGQVRLIKGDLSDADMRDF